MRSYCNLKKKAKILYSHIAFVWFDVYIPVNSYGHVEKVSSPNHTFFWASLTKQLISTKCAYFHS